jgi:hypothetical protein
VTDRLAADHGKAADDDDGADEARERYSLTKQDGREQQAAEGRAGRLDHAAMPERHEQEAAVADEREHRATQHQQHKTPPPPDPAEIPDSRTPDEGQEGKTGPEEAVHQEIDRHQGGFQAVPGGDKPERPAQCGASTAGDPEQGRGGVRFAVRFSG